ncbi:hypothetical protein [Candidatus Magnetobacterium casense]|uniref:hypothetical protein n=1 Tax=Candidatus Magnetobacterium casense TaxID=1455061 RepID=UPI00190F5FEC|nr:hypothetical protein [Candidatus Magnetobacterium casensis]
MRQWRNSPPFMGGVRGGWMDFGNGEQITRAPIAIHIAKMLKYQYVMKVRDIIYY